MSESDVVGIGGEPAQQRLTDALLAVAMALVVALVIAAHLDGIGQVTPAAYLFAVGFGALTLAGRRLPRVALVLTVLGIFSYYAFSFPPIGMALPAVAALYRAAERGRSGWAVGGAAVLVAVSAYFRVAQGLPTAYLFSYDLLTNVALAAASVALGVSVRARRETRRHQGRLRDMVAAEQVAEAEHRLQVERVRIAQDLHDTVGHTMSVIAVHSNVAAEAIGNDDEAAHRAVEQIGTATSAQLRELRAIVKILRSPASDAERSAVGLSGLAALAERARQAGVAVDLDVDVTESCLDGAIQAAAYRIVQESLTNVLRHSGASHVSVTAGVRGDRLELVIADDGSGPANTRPAGTGSGSGSGSGQGLSGMRERAAMLGGRLTADRGTHGGFVVHAVLPARLPA